MTGHAIIANEFIKEINKRILENPARGFGGFKKQLPEVDVFSVALRDPQVPH
jgi:hypothetical protein